MEPVILLIAVVLALMLGLIRSFVYVPSGLSEFELKRRAEGGDGQAAYELHRRPLLAALVGLKNLKSAGVLVILVTLLVATLEWWVGLLVALVIVALVELVVAKGWVAGMARGLQHATEPSIIGLVRGLQGFLRLFAPRGTVAQGYTLGSREELVEIIASDTHLLSADEKARVQAAMQFGNLKVSDVMVPGDKIDTVDVSETVGPVLLDTLHKAGRKIFVAVKKGLDDIKGLAYMSDLTSGHPDIKKVKDVVRPRIEYVGPEDSLDSVLQKVVATGKQLFLVKDDGGEVVGLVTLRDVLAKLGVGKVAAN